MPALAWETALAVLVGMLAMLAGVVVLNRRWKRRSGYGPRSVPVGWLAIAAGVALFVEGLAAELGIACGLLLLSLIAYAVLAAGVQLRSARTRAPREIAPEPQERRTSPARGAIKAFLAIVLAGAAALGLGLAFAIGMPLGTHDRIVIGGLLVPILWGAGMAWTLCDAKLLRATGLLVAVGAFGYGVAFLPKLLG